ncbi:MAG: radical SAM protein [Chloroflexota bacterium]|nr:radical SAM protein [Chloroflexota bacterium]
MTYRPLQDSGLTYSMPNLKKLESYSFEVGPIRPPSEAHSLLIRATRNCSWNRCEFCPVYKGQKFQLRHVEEVLQDINIAREIHDQIKTMAWQAGYGGRSREMAALVYNNFPYHPSVQNIAFWMHNAKNYAFLQDANTLIMPTPDLVQVVCHLKNTFPEIERITSYARSKTAAKKSQEEMDQIREAGLTQLHIGLESGNDQVLALMQKGVTGEEQIRGGRMVVQSGITLSEYVMPGLGGRHLSKAHVEDSARVLSAINPDFIRIRTLVVHQIMPLWEKTQNGEFEQLNEDELVEELGLLIEGLHCNSTIRSDHMMNLLMDVEGKLPEDRERILAPIKRYQSLPEQERCNFIFGRRAGLYNSLDDMNNEYQHEMVEQAVQRIKGQGNDVSNISRQLREQSI